MNHYLFGLLILVIQLPWLICVIAITRIHDKMERAFLAFAKEVADRTKKTADVS